MMSPHSNLSLLGLGLVKISRTMVSYGLDWLRNYRNIGIIRSIGNLDIKI